MKLIDVVAAALVGGGAELETGRGRAFRPGRDAVGLSFGEVSGLTAVVYGRVGVAGLYQALFWERTQSRWLQPARHHA